MILATGLVVLGNDLGTALVLFALLLGSLWVVGAPRRFFTVMFSVVAVGLLVLVGTNAERLGRVTNFIDPFSDYHDKGWQPAHGLYALSTGGLFGQGIGASQQKWGDLPEAHTDFIFAVLGEELGLAGTLLVITLFLTIAFAALRVARRTDDPFVRYASFGIVVWLVGQMMINVGMVLALLPVIGIPLPLISYGGSALLPSLVALGLLVGFARREPEAARALAQRRKLRSAGLSAAPLPLSRRSLPTSLQPMRILLAGGGTAGHTSPLLATADALRRLDPAAEITCLGTRPRAGDPRRPRGRLPAGADRAGARCPASPRPTCCGSRAGCAAR